MLIVREWPCCHRVFNPMSQRSKKKARQGKAAAVHSSEPASPAGERPGVEGSRWLESKSRPAGLNDRWLVPGVCIFLAAIVWAVFGQTLHHEFVNYDDDFYVYKNPAVTRGLTLQGIIWAFTHVHCSNWHPLTWISDCLIAGTEISQEESINAPVGHLVSGHLVLRLAPSRTLF